MSNRGGQKEALHFEPVILSAKMTRSRADFLILTF